MEQAGEIAVGASRVEVRCRAAGGLVHGEHGPVQIVSRGDVPRDGIDDVQRRGFAGFLQRAQCGNGETRDVEHGGFLDGHGFRGRPVRPDLGIAGREQKRGERQGKYAGVQDDLRSLRRASECRRRARG